MKYALPILALLGYCLDTNPSNAEGWCPTALDLDRGIKFESDLTSGNYDSVLTFERLPSGLADALNLPPNLDLGDYALSQWRAGPATWNTRISYKGVLTILSMTDGTVLKIVYPDGWRNVFPLNIGDHHEFNVILQVPNFDDEGKFILPPRAEQKAIISINILGETKIAVGPCDFDTLILKTTVEDETQSGTSEKIVDISYYAPALGTWVASGQLEDGRVTFEETYKTVMPLPESERWQN